MEANAWDLDAAVAEYYADQDEEMLNPPSASAGAGGGDFAGGRRLGTGEPAEPPRTARTLGGATASASRPSQPRSAPKKKFATLGDLTSQRSEDSEEDDNQDFFAGGEKSGLAVQNPDDIKREIIEKARR